jgi:hypothetical protein
LDDSDWRKVSQLGSEEEFDRVRAALNPEECAEFDSLWEELRESREDLPTAEHIAERLLELRIRTLEGEPDWGKRLAPLSALDRPYEAVVLADLFAPRHPVAALQQQVRRWLLSSPALEQARAEGLLGIWRPPLIRLPRPDGSAQYPAFQFEPGGTPIQIVLRINELLDASRDPWGAAGWWLGTSLWFPGPPAAMIGAVPDSRLLAAARGAFEGEW